MWGIVRVFFMLFALTEARISSDLLAFFMIIILTKPRYFLAFFIEKFKQISTFNKYMYS